MKVDSMDALQNRLHRLERRQRLNILAWLGVVHFLILGMRSAGDGVPDALVARSIQLVDEENRVRAELGIDAEGSAGLFLRDAEGRLRGTLIHDDAQTGLFLLDDTGTIRVGAAQFAHGGGGFALHGDQSKGAVVLYLKNRRGSLSLIDENGTVTDRVPALTPPEEDHP